MRHALTNVLFIALAFLLCGAVECFANARPCALLRVSHYVRAVAGKLKRNSHSKSAVTI
jgi:hypothetical protein